LVYGARVYDIDPNAEVSEAQNVATRRALNGLMRAGRVACWQQYEFMGEHCAGRMWGLAEDDEAKLHGQSDRSLAREAGVSESTMRRARRCRMEAKREHEAERKARAAAVWRQGAARSW
jgi:hypothetical protein